MKILLLTLSIFILLLNINQSFSKDPPLLVAQELKSQGKVTSCSLVFRSYGSDYRYKYGKEIRIDGSFTVHNSNITGLLLKLIVRDVDNQEIWSDDINYAYFSLDDAKSSASQEVQKTINTDNNAFLAVYNDVNFLTSLLNDFKLINISFNRIKNGLDVTIPVNNDSEAHSKFSSCVDKILQPYSANNIKP